MKSKIQFLTVGGVAFIADISLYFLLTEIMTLNLIYSRFLAFLVAVCITCIGNTKYTFSGRPKVTFAKQYSKSVTAAVFSFVPNMFSFWLLLMLLPNGIIFSLIAFVVGTGVGIVLNYTLSNKYVFAPSSLS